MYIFMAAAINIITLSVQLKGHDDSVLRQITFTKHAHVHVGPPVLNLALWGKILLSSEVESSSISTVLRPAAILIGWRVV